MTSSILPPRSVLAPCSPITQASASTTFDLPDPLGPTTQVTPGSKANVVGCANDLKPLSVRLFKYTQANLPDDRARAAPERRTRPDGVAGRRHTSDAEVRRTMTDRRTSCRQCRCHP